MVPQTVLRMVGSNCTVWLHKKYLECFVFLNLNVFRRFLRDDGSYGYAHFFKENLPNFQYTDLKLFMVMTSKCFLIEQNGFKLSVAIRCKLF